MAMEFYGQMKIEMRISTFKKDENEFKREFKNEFGNSLVTIKHSLEKLLNSQLENFLVKDKPKKPKKSINRLKVKFPDGRVVKEQYAKRTFLETIQMIGVQRVRQLGLERNGVPLVDKTVHDKYKKTQIKVGAKIYIQTYGSTEDKKKYLDIISEKLGLGLNVKIVQNNCL